MKWTFANIRSGSYAHIGGRSSRSNHNALYEYTPEPPSIVIGNLDQLAVGVAEGDRRDGAGARR